MLKIIKTIKAPKKIVFEIIKYAKAGKSLKLIGGKEGFGLIGIIVGLLIISVMVVSAVPYLEGYYKLGQAKAAVNTANALINAENQYQMASYSNYAENGSVSSNNDYFGTLTQLYGGLNILPSGNKQYFLPQGTSLSLASYGGNGDCIQKNIGGAAVTECLNDEKEGQYALIIYGLNNSGLPAYVPMFENGIKGGITSYEGGALTTQINVPFAFSAYPKTQNGGANAAVNNNTTVERSGGGGGGAAAPNVQCTEWNHGGSCAQYTYSNGAQTSNLNGYAQNPGSVCIEVSPGGTCVAWSR